MTTFDDLVCTLWPPIDSPGRHLGPGDLWLGVARGPAAEAHRGARPHLHGAGPGGVQDTGRLWNMFCDLDINIAVCNVCD